MTGAVDQEYSYLRPSSCSVVDGTATIELATSTGIGIHPSLWSGTLINPRQDATMLLAVARVARTRFYTPAAMLAAELRSADPVVTAHGDRLRFESFSACAGAYARLDLDTSSLHAAFLSHGTTNVDFNMPMRSALGRIVDHSTAKLSVGLHEVELEAAGEHVVERKVPLPTRWIKGFAETQLSQSRMTRLHELSPAEATRFLRSLPSSHTGHARMWAVASGKGLRLSARPSPTAVAVGGAERLRPLVELVRWARLLRVYGEEEGSSAWELVLPDASFALVLSPDASRGFSGEGGVLADLADPATEQAADILAGELCWQSRLDVGDLSRRTGLAPTAVTAGLARLGASGLIGYDLALGSHFHRLLPFDPAAFESMNPRLQAAHRLVDSSAVRLLDSAEHPGTIESMVRSGDVEHAVRVAGADARCSCPWYGRHHGTRGPCKHVLATRLFMAQRQRRLPK